MYNSQFIKTTLLFTVLIFAALGPPPHTSHLTRQVPEYFICLLTILSNKNISFVATSSHQVLMVIPHNIKSSKAKVQSLPCKLNGVIPIDRVIPFFSCDLKLIITLLA